MLFEMIRPDDWHVHLREGTILNDTVNATAASYARALVMPNLSPPITTIQAILNYRQHILEACLPLHQGFYPYMTLFLHEDITAETIYRAKSYDWILGAKLYPANVTTHSAKGIRSIKALYPIFEIMQELDLVLQIHGESLEADIFARETSFLAETLTPLCRQFPKLRMVLEHISTRAAVDFIFDAPDTIAATITPHHLLYDRNDLLSGGIKPHLYCLPILKKPEDKTALLYAAFSGHPKFFGGTDSAPHPVDQKESACGCAGIYSAPFSLALYAELFETHGELSKLSAFLGEFGARFYHQPINSQRILLSRQAQQVPSSLSLGDHSVIPIKAGESLSWSLYDPHHSPL